MIRWHWSSATAGVCVIASLCSFLEALQAPKEKRNARQVAEAYVSAALAGQTKEAMALAEPGQSPSSEARIADLPKRLVVKTLSLPRVYVSDSGRALAVSEVVVLTRAQPDGQDQIQLVVTLALRGGNWLVRDVDFRTPDGAKEQVQRFHRKNPDAKELPAQERASLEQDLKKLEGTWYPAKAEAKLREFAIDIQIRKSNVLIQYGAPGGGNMVQIKGFESAFELKQAGDKRRIVPTKKNAGISEITYRLEKDRLVIEEGTAGDKMLKGVWERGKDLAP